MIKTFLLIRHPGRIRFLLLGAVLILVVSVLARWTSVPAPLAYNGSTWSIVAVDPQTGDVGVAAASCVPVPIDAVAALVPGQGAAAVQAALALPNRNQVFARLQEGLTAEAVIKAVTDPAFDNQTAIRQYGVVTLNEGEVQAAGFTGTDNGIWAGDVQDLEVAVSVQGNILEGEAVVGEALAAFRVGSGPLPDRLIQALEAGSAAGGDRRCNRDGVEQTAQSAFIMVARAGQRPFAVAQFGQSPQNRADAPWLYLSVTEPLLGDNPLVELRRQYDLWRAEHLPEPAQSRPSFSPVTYFLLGLASLAFLAGVIWLAVYKPKKSA